jgi:predicted Rossmann fold nucleotide-binding protein DprA/Smf involved in DNA uptake
MATQRQKQKVQDAAMNLAFAKSAYEQAQKEFDEAFKEATSGPRAKKGAVPSSENGDIQPQPGEDVAKTSMAKIEQALASDQNKQFKYKEIEKLTGLPIPSIKAFLFRLKKQGKANKVGRGLWQTCQLTLLK